MKKNWVLRLGLLAMVLTLVTMPMVSSTYAKYVTTANGTATARVAQWNVNVETDFDNLFGHAYAVGANSVATTWNATPAAASITVNADTADEFVFAPGTTGSFTFTITGTPEVALDLNVDATVTLSNDWKVAGAAYEPITFTFKNGTQYYNPSTGQFDNGTTAVNMTATQLQTALKNLDSTDGTPASINANTNLVTALPSYDSGVAGATGVYVVDWVWPFEGPGETGGNWKSSFGSDVSTLYVEDTGTPGTYELSSIANGYTGFFIPGTTYYVDVGGAVADTSTYVPAGSNITYDEADTALGNLADGTTPSLAITLTITATQKN